MYVVPYFIVGYPGRLTWVSFIKCAKEVGANTVILFYPEKNIKWNDEILDNAIQQASKNDISLKFLIQSIGRYNRFFEMNIFIGVPKGAAFKYGLKKLLKDAIKNKIKGVIFSEKFPESVILTDISSQSKVIQIKNLKEKPRRLLINLDILKWKDVEKFFKYADGFFFGKELVKIIGKSRKVGSMISKIKSYIKKMM